MAKGSAESILGKFFLLLIAVFAVLYAISPKSNIPQRFERTSPQVDERSTPAQESPRVRAEPDDAARAGTERTPAPSAPALTTESQRAEPKQDRKISQQPSPVRLEKIAICRGIIGKQPMGSATAFSDTTKRLYCYTAITGALAPTTISHIWFHENDKLAEVKLEVAQSSWRTWSSKRIIPQWVGQWRVEILDASGLLIGKKEFAVQ